LHLLNQALISRYGMKYFFKMSHSAANSLGFSVRFFVHEARRPSAYSLNCMWSILLLSLSIFYTSSTVLAASSNEELRGLWIDHKQPEKQKVAVWIEDCNGTLCGRIYWMKSMRPTDPPRQSANSRFCPQRQQFINTIIFTGREFFQGLFKPSKRFDVIRLGGGEQTLNSRCALPCTF
jgi:hypothetical protein